MSSGCPTANWDLQYLLQAQWEGTKWLIHLGEATGCAAKQCNAESFPTIKERINIYPHAGKMQFSEHGA